MYCTYIHTYIQIQATLYYILYVLFVHSYNGAPKKLGLKLPVFITKFLQGTSMNSQDFFKRWKQLGNELSQETQKIFSGKFPCDSEAIKDTVSFVIKCFKYYIII